MPILYARMSDLQRNFCSEKGSVSNWVVQPLSSFRPKPESRTACITRPNVGFKAEPPPRKAQRFQLGGLTSLVIPAQAGISYRLHYTPECRIYGGTSTRQSAAFPIGRFNLPCHSGASRNLVPPALHARMSDFTAEPLPSKAQRFQLGGSTSLVIPTPAGIWRAAQDGSPAKPPKRSLTLKAANDAMKIARTATPGPYSSTSKVTSEKTS